MSVRLMSVRLLLDLIHNKSAKFVKISFIFVIFFTDKFHLAILWILSNECCLILSKLILGRSAETRMSKNLERNSSLVC